MNVLVVDVGGTNVKILATGNDEPPENSFRADHVGRTDGRRSEELAGDWNYDAVSIGYPGLVLRGQVALEPYNLAPGWMSGKTLFGIRVPGPPHQRCGHASPWVVTRRESSCFWDWEPVSAPALVARASWCRWSSLTSLCLPPLAVESESRGDVDFKTQGLKPLKNLSQRHG